MNKKTLILLCDTYPFSNGEYFIDDELKVIASSFEKVIVLTNSAQQLNNGTRFVPSNAVVDVVSTKKSVRILDLQYFFLFFKEVYYLIYHLKMRLNFLRIKIILNEIYRSIIYKKKIIDYLEHSSIDINAVVFYSYWLDYKSLSLALLAKERKAFTTVSRAHRWDIYFEENPAAYLPFKRFIINSLSKTFSISQDGKDYLENLPGVQKEKVGLSRLGKSTGISPNFLKQMPDSFIICSCSSLTHVKRVDLIIQVLRLLKTKNVCWYHFGEGSLRQRLEELARLQLDNCSFEFVGALENAKLFEFYKNNFVDLFINLSESEGIPVSIMEAQSVGIPVIATEVGGVSEIVNSNNGWIFPKHFDELIVSATIDTYFLSSKNAIMQKREAAYQNWEKHYNGQINYLNFSHQLLNC